MDKSDKTVTMDKMEKSDKIVKVKKNKNIFRSTSIHARGAFKNSNFDDNVNFFLLTLTFS